MGFHENFHFLAIQKNQLKMFCSKYLYKIGSLTALKKVAYTNITGQYLYSAFARDSKI